jgi:cell division transport system permease protein
MALSIEYVAKETGNNLRRNVLMTTGAILCVAVSLTIVGIALVLKQGVSRATIQWRNGVDMSVFMKPDAPQQQTQAIQTQLQSEKGTDIKSFTYCDQACAYREFKTMFANSPEFQQSVGQSDLPPSFRVVPTHPELIQQIGDKYTNQPGVQSVQYAKDAIKGLLTVTHYAQVAFLSLAAILLVLAILLIVNTIRMAIFSRRREVAVMKLVGATNWFIRIPFMTEGMIQGIAGASVAFGVVYVLRNVVFHLVGHNSIFNNLVASTHDVIVTGIAILVVGAVVGGGGSAAAVSRFLDV